MHDWQIEYQGHDLDPDSCEAILHTRWPEKELRLEPELFQTKAFDLRHLHPVAATLLFAHIFTEETRTFIRAHIDDTPPRTLPSGRVLDWYPLGQGNLFDPPSDERKLKAWKRKINALVRARQFADRFGIPYRFLIRRALRHWYFGRNYIFEEHRTLPGPDMLNGDECRAAIAEAWLEELQARIQYATHPRYLVQNGDGHHDVREHQEFLCDQIAKKINPVPALSKFMGMGLLSQEVARQRFGEERVSKALAGVAK